MLAVDRGLFSKYNAYADSPQSIGYGATISAPHMVSFTIMFTSVLPLLIFNAVYDNLGWLGGVVVRASDL